MSCRLRNGRLRGVGLPGRRRVRLVAVPEVGEGVGHGLLLGWRQPAAELALDDAHVLDEGLVVSAPPFGRQDDADSAPVVVRVDRSMRQVRGRGRSRNQVDWARSRCTVPETPLSSTSPISRKANPESVVASATCWLTRTSPGRA